MDEENETMKSMPRTLIIPLMLFFKTVTPGLSESDIKLDKTGVRDK